MSIEQEKAIQPFRNPVPANLEDWQRIIKQKPTLNDLVEAAIRAIMLDPNYSEQFQLFISAVDDAETVEGSMAADNLEAANLIRDYARNHNQFKELATKKKVAIVHALNTVLRRYRISRTDRAQTVSGEVVPANSGT